MLLKIPDALGKNIHLQLEERCQPMNQYSLRLYDEELLSFSLEERGLEGLIATILSVNKTKKELLPLDLVPPDKGILKWLERRVIPKNRTFVDEIPP